MWAGMAVPFCRPPAYFGASSCAASYCAAFVAVHMVCCLCVPPASQVDMTAITDKYRVARGEVQHLQDHAARFASMAAAFCERLGWFDLEALIVKFQVGC